MDAITNIASVKSKWNTGEHIFSFALYQHTYCNFNFLLRLICHIFIKHHLYSIFPYFTIFPCMYYFNTPRKPEHLIVGVCTKCLSRTTNITPQWTARLPFIVVWHGNISRSNPILQPGCVLLSAPLSLNVCITRAAIIEVTVFYQ